MSDDWACGSRFFKIKMRMEVVVAFVVWLLRMNICISMYLMTAKNSTCDPYHHRYQIVVSISDTSTLVSP